MAFHRLTVPVYAGGLRGGDDYVNNAVVGVPAPADAALGAGVYIGSYFFAQSDLVTGAAINRGLKALAQNCDFLDDEIVQMALDYAAADAANMALLADDSPSGDLLVGAIAKGTAPGSYVLPVGTVNSQLTALKNLINGSFGVRTLVANAVLDDGAARDDLIVINANTITFTLLNPALHAGRRIFFTDKSGTLGIGAAFSIVRFGAELIDGVAATYDCTTPNGRWMLTCDGTDWYLFVC